MKSQYFREVSHQIMKKKELILQKVRNDMAPVLVLYIGNQHNFLNERIMGQSFRHFSELEGLYNTALADF